MPRNATVTCATCKNQYLTRHYCQVEATPQDSMRAHWSHCRCDNCVRGAYRHIRAVDFPVRNGRPLRRMARPPHTVLYIGRGAEGKVVRMAWVCEACNTFDGYDCNGSFHSLAPRRRPRRPRPVRVNSVTARWQSLTNDIVGEPQTLTDEQRRALLSLTQANRRYVEPTPDFVAPVAPPISTMEWESVEDNELRRSRPRTRSR